MTIIKKETIFQTKYSTSISFYERAINVTQDLLQDILNHPFNTELLKGTLNFKIFLNYLSQDVLYLKYFSNCYNNIADKMDNLFPDKFEEYKTIFIEKAQGAIAFEQDIQNNIYNSNLGVKKIPFLSESGLEYMDHLWNHCNINTNIAVVIASLLPCFVVYRELGKTADQILEDKSTDNKIYDYWLSTYRGKEFYDTVDTLIDIVNQIALKYPNEIEGMVLEYRKSMNFELDFWNSAYHELNNCDKIQECQIIHHGKELSDAINHTCFFKICEIS